jgi:thymidylate synthase (FAD)
VTFTFEVKAPIFIFRQWHRHRTWSFNELSARYRELPEEFYVPAPEVIGQQSTSSKQARTLTVDPDEVASEQIREACAAAFQNYRILLDRGVPRELARSVLPVATYSHMFATVDLLNLLKFLTLRSHSHAQWEIQQYANALRTLAETVAPVSVAAWAEGEG